MANNYTQTSFMLTKLNPVESAWLKDAFEEGQRKADEEDNFDEYIGVSYEFEQKEGYEDLWIYAEEGFMVDNLACLLQAFLKEHRPDEYISFTWSNTCSKMRLDEFSGGGVFITAKSQKWCVPYAFIDKEAAKLKKKKASTS